MSMNNLPPERQFYLRSKGGRITALLKNGRMKFTKKTGSAAGLKSARMERGAWRHVWTPEEARAAALKAHESRKRNRAAKLARLAALAAQEHSLPVQSPPAD